MGLTFNLLRKAFATPLNYLSISSICDFLFKWGPLIQGPLRFKEQSCIYTYISQLPDSLQNKQ